MNEEINEIEFRIHRNKEFLKYLISKYKIEKSLDEILNYESVFFFEEREDKNDRNSTLKRAFLYANAKYETNNKKIEKVVKKEIVYNFGKKLMKGLTESEIDSIVIELELFASAVKQIKLINKMEYLEDNLNIYTHELFYNSDFKID